MRITLFIRVLVMDAVGRYPKNRAALKRESRAYRQKIFHPFWGLVPPVREQTVIAHSNTQATGDPPQKSRNEECLPRKKEERCNRPDVEGRHKESGDPVDLVVC